MTNMYTVAELSRKRWFPLKSRQIREMIKQKRLPSTWGRKKRKTGFVFARFVSEADARKFAFAYQNEAINKD